jgi:hypothetical protein
MRAASLESTLAESDPDTSSYHESVQEETSSEEGDPLDFCEILELRKETAAVEAETEVGAQGLKRHPDKNPDDEEEATQRFTAIPDACLFTGD